jgi:hypothetical protein
MGLGMNDECVNEFMKRVRLVVDDLYDEAFGDGLARGHGYDGPLHSQNPVDRAMMILSVVLADYVFSNKSGDGDPVSRVG